MKLLNLLQKPNKEDNWFKTQQEYATNRESYEILTIFKVTKQQYSPMVIGSESS